ncbi:acyltransferase family protein [Mucilaginibacter pocheonensis]|uniref:Fucose 4-O-acetylase-like acetyltransferase n=1 Tax=Mucilaginibacter pocheonensis TaxID=398050 RepID=A0ABU1TGD2_9SPHI|nr:acyltransferase [Mucilaginibacter pocheonensis]MDR6944306.1 fucose 4-O-acetylase-like acetyltransferase [Mucilaginibacter pocheonensis]
MKISQTNKNLSIETLRGLAIILMVLGHVIGSASDNGLKVADDSVWRFSYYAFQYIRMPLFTVISGFVYAYKPVSRFTSNSKFIVGKINRLLIPLVVVATLFYLLQYITPGTNSKNDLNDIWRIYVYPYAHFWFLQGMMIVFLIITVLENFKALDTLKSAIICLLIAALIFIALPYKFNYFSLNRVPFLLTFFILGLSLKRFYEAIFKKNLVKMAGLIFVISISYQLYLFDVDTDVRIANLLTFCVGSTACILMISLGYQNKKLIWLGDFSYGIYLFHIFGAVTARVLLAKLSVHNIPLQILIGLTAGISFPVLLRLLCGSNKVFSVLFFGDKISAVHKKKHELDLKSTRSITSSRTFPN